MSLKLHYSKGACSLAPHIVLEDLGLPFEAIKENIRAPSDGFLRLNPMGAVPVLEMENGQPLTEVSAIVQYLADLKPESGLAPRAGTLERNRLQEWLGFIATEIHKGFSPLWGVESMTQNKEAQEDIRRYATAALAGKFEVILDKLGTRPFLMETGYSVADAYLFTVLNWSNYLKLDMSPWPGLVKYMERVKARPATIRAMHAEHLIA